METTPQMWGEDDLAASSKGAHEGNNPTYVGRTCLEHIALEIIAFGEVNSPCDNLAAGICRQIPAERIANFQWQFAPVRIGMSGGTPCRKTKPFGRQGGTAFPAWPVHQNRMEAVLKRRPHFPREALRLSATPASQRNFRWTASTLSAYLKPADASGAPTYAASARFRSPYFAI